MNVGVSCECFSLVRSGRATRIGVSQMWSTRPDPTHTRSAKPSRPRRFGTVVLWLGQFRTAPLDALVTGDGALLQRSGCQSSFTSAGHQEPWHPDRPDAETTMPIKPGGTGPFAHAHFLCALIKARSVCVLTWSNRARHVAAAAPRSVWFRARWERHAQADAKLVRN
jgi:hypothetical protein